MNKINLITGENDYPVFLLAWIRPLIEDYFNIEYFDPNKTYSKDDVFLIHYVTELENNWAQPYIEQGHKCIVEHLWDSDVEFPSKVNGNVLTLRNPNWIRYLTCLEWTFHTYNQYRPEPNYQHAFLMPINKTRWHRTEIVKRLDTVLDQALYSYVEHGKQLPDDTTSKIVTPWLSHFNPAWYNSTCFSVAVESYMRSAGSIPGTISYRTEISEKSFKPMAFFHPMIVVGSVDTLKYLHSQGFETFDNLWDESYDDIQDDHQRLDKCVEVVLDAVKMYNTGNLKIDTVTQQKLEHNHAHFFDKDLVQRRFRAEIVGDILEFLAR